MLLKNLRNLENYPFNAHYTFTQVILCTEVIYLFPVIYLICLSDGIHAIVIVIVVFVLWKDLVTDSDDLILVLQTLREGGDLQLWRTDNGQLISTFSIGSKVWHVLHF